MQDIDYINTQDIRKNLVGFLKTLEGGREVAIVKRSKVVARLHTIPQASAPYQKSTQRLLEIADQIRAQAKPVLDPNKSIKELYRKTMDNKYGIS